MTRRFRRYRWIPALAVAALVALALVLITGSSSRAGLPPGWFGPSSFWNSPVPAHPVIDAHSSEMVHSLARFGYTAHVADDHTFGIPIAYAAPDDPAYSIRSRVYPAGPPSVRCRIAPNAGPDLGSDGHLTVIQPDGTACDFWRFARRRRGGPTAATVGRTCGRVVGSHRDAWGTIPCRGRLGDGATASGFALAGGLILSGQLGGRARIAHALAVSLPVPTVRSGPTWPATHSDGECPSQSRCIPEGARIQLSPRFHVAAQRWPLWEKKIAYALQTYGAFVVDKGGSITISAQDLGTNAAWAAQGIPVDASLANLPWTAMRVLHVHRHRRPT